MKFGTKIKFLKTKRTNHWKRWGTKVNFLYEIQIYHLFYLYFSLWSSDFQSNPSSLKNMQLGANLSYKGLILQENIREPNWKFLKMTIQSIMICEKVHCEIYYCKRATCLSVLFFALDGCRGRDQNVYHVKLKSPPSN
jgi:hypothetical protein